MLSELEVADIFLRHGHAYARVHEGHLGRVERRVMSAIEQCRTAALGGHVETCDDCACVDAPRFASGFSDFFRHSASSVVCQASGRGLSTPRGRYAVRTTRATPDQRACFALAPGLVDRVVNIEILAA